MAYKVLGGVLGPIVGPHGVVGAAARCGRLAGALGRRLGASRRRQEDAPRGRGPEPNLAEAVEPVARRARSAS